MATEEQVRELREKLIEERAALIEALRDMTDARAAYRQPDRDGEEGWSVKEQLGHLADAEALYRGWVRRTLAEDRPDLGDGRVPAERAAYNVDNALQQPLPALVQELLAQRERTFALMATIAPADYDRTARSPAFGELNVLQWLRSNYRHERMHRAQMLGERSAYRPNFLQGEPDQRRTASRDD